MSMDRQWNGLPKYIITYGLVVYGNFFNWIEIKPLAMYKLYTSNVLVSFSLYKNHLENLYN